jgi:ABC-2 type transport system permease protein
MTAAITPASKMLTLVRREFHEHRILFLYMPLLITLMVTVAFAVVALLSYLLDFNFVGMLEDRVIAETQDEISMALREFSDLPFVFKMQFWEQFYTQTPPILYISLWGALFYYFQMTLYSQRTDRSILFWNSMPVSDTETVVSKLLAGYVLCHAIYLAFLFALQVMMLLVMMVCATMFDINVWDNVVAPSGIISRFAYLFGFSFLSIFWSLPVYAWLLLTSAWAKSAPFAWAMAPVVVLVVIELIFFGVDIRILGLFFEHAFPTVIGNGPDSDFTLGGKLLGVEMLLSILLGIGFIYGAIRLNRSEDS